MEVVENIVTFIKWYVTTDVLKIIIINWQARKGRPPLCVPTQCFELEMSAQTQVWIMWSPAGDIILGSDGLIRRYGQAGRSRSWGANFVSGFLPHSNSLSDLS